MKPVEVARQAAGTLSGLGVRVHVTRVPGMANHQALAWLDNGFGVSVVTWAPDPFPEVKITRRGKGLDWVPPRTVRVGSERWDRGSDGSGIIRNVTPAELAAVLAALHEWDVTVGA